MTPLHRLAPVRSMAAPTCGRGTGRGVSPNLPESVGAPFGSGGHRDVDTDRGQVGDEALSVAIAWESTGRSKWARVAANWRRNRSAWRSLVFEPSTSVYPRAFNSPISGAIDSFAVKMSGAVASSTFFCFNVGGAGHP